MTTPKSPDSVNASTALLEQIIQSVASGIVALDENGVILASNPAACAFLDCVAAELSPGSLVSRINHIEPFLAVVDEVYATHRPVHRLEVHLRLKSGEKREIGMSIAMLNGAKPFNGIILLFTDITERRQLERSAEINRQLASIGELTAGVVHELRNPLMVISGMSELIMRNTEAESKSFRSAETIFNEVRTLENAISQFLGFARPFEVEPRRCCPDAVADRAMQLCQRRAEMKSVLLRCEMDPNLPECALDVGKTAQAVANIASNAIDEVPAETGVVSLRVFATESHLAFDVADNGSGIALGLGEDLFKPFFTKKESGTGLGLAIAHRIITAHRGTIRYYNLPQGGACFEIRIPLQTPAAWD